VADERLDEPLRLQAGLRIVGDRGIGGCAHHLPAPAEHVPQLAEIDADPEPFGGVDNVGDVDKDRDAGQGGDRGGPLKAAEAAFDGRKGTGNVAEHGELLGCEGV